MLIEVTLKAEIVKNKKYLRSILKDTVMQIM